MTYSYYGYDPYANLGGAPSFMGMGGGMSSGYSQMPTAPTGGIPWGQMGAGLNFGMSLGSGIANFANQMGAIKRQNHNMAENFEGTQAQLRDLLGIASGNVLTHPGNEFVGGHEDPRSRYLATGTLVGGPAGGINPLVMKARQNIYNLMQTQAIQDKDLGRMQQATNNRIGGGLNQSSGRNARNPRELLGQLLNFAGAGQAANVGIQAQMANRAFGQQVAGQGLNFLNQLFASAGGTY